MSDVLPPATWEAARALVRRYGWNAASYQILNPGFQHWVAAGGDAVVGYIERHGVRVVGGAPIAPEHRMGAVIAEFEAAAGAAGRRVLYFAAESRLLHWLHAEPARTSFAIGAQPIWSARALSASLESHASLRAQLHRARNKGVCVRALTTFDVLAAQPTLQGLLEQWLMRRGLPPLHFLVETATLARPEDRRVWLAECDAVPIAFLVATPIPARSGWLIEQIVRGTAAPNGTSELLLAAAAAGLPPDALLTLGLAPLSRHAALSDSGPLRLRLLFEALRRAGRRFYDFDGLDAFKAKFRPTLWEPVYASLGPGLGLTRALLAITGAFGGERVRDFAVHSLRHTLSRGARRAGRALRASRP